VAPAPKPEVVTIISGTFRFGKRRRGAKGELVPKEALHLQIGANEVATWASVCWG